MSADINFQNNLNNALEGGYIINGQGININNLNNENFSNARGITIELFFNLLTINTTNPTVLFSFRSNSINNGIYATINSISGLSVVGNLSVRLGFGSSNITYNFNSFTFKINRNYHVILIIRNAPSVSNNFIALYVNGVFIQQNSFSSSRISFATTGDSSFFHTNFIGTAYLLRIYNRECIPFDIIRYYNNGRPDLYLPLYRESNSTSNIIYSINNQSITLGQQYIIIANSTANFTLLGAPNNSIGTEFIVNNIPSSFSWGDGQLIRVGCVVELRPENIFKNIWADSQNNYNGIPPSNIINYNYLKINQWNSTPSNFAVPTEKLIKDEFNNLLLNQNQSGFNSEISGYVFNNINQNINFPSRSIEFFYSNSAFSIESAFVILNTGSLNIIRKNNEWLIQFYFNYSNSHLIQTYCYNNGNTSNYSRYSIELPINFFKINNPYHIIFSLENPNNAVYYINGIKFNVTKSNIGTGFLFFSNSNNSPHIIKTNNDNTNIFKPFLYRFYNKFITEEESKIIYSDVYLNNYSLPSYLSYGSNQNAFSYSLGWYEDSNITMRPVNVISTIRHIPLNSSGSCANTEFTISNANKIHAKYMYPTILNNYKNKSFPSLYYISVWTRAGTNAHIATVSVYIQNNLIAHLTRSATPDADNWYNWYGIVNVYSEFDLFFSASYVGPLNGTQRYYIDDYHIIRLGCVASYTPESAGINVWHDIQNELHANVYNVGFFTNTTNRLLTYNSYKNISNSCFILIPQSYSIDEIYIHNKSNQTVTFRFSASLSGIGSRILGPFSASIIYGSQLTQSVFLGLSFMDFRITSSVPTVFDTNILLKRTII